MKLAIISDQHGELPEIPKCDLLIISGDVTGGNPAGPRDYSEPKWGNWLQVQFAKWVEKIPQVIVVAGNHDTAIELDGFPKIPNVKYLCGDYFEHGGFVFFGAPWVKFWDGLAFNLKDRELGEKWKKITNQADVLVLHQPPLGCGDNGLGCPELRRVILRTRPKLVTCGHIHEGRGTYDLQGTTVINSARGFTEFELK